MTHHVHPYLFRIGQLRPWKSRWFNRRDFIRNLQEDTLVREMLIKRLRQSHIESIEIERFPNTFHLLIRTSRPGVLIGRSGEGAERLREEVRRYLQAINRRRGRAVNPKREIKLTIEEVRSPETHAAIVAQMIVEDLEKRIPFRRVLKQNLERVSASREVKGVKIALKGRLDGAEMARYEWAKHGRIPLQTIRADVDYAEKTAYTTYGTIGVKVWIYKGEIFEKSEARNPKSETNSKFK